MTWREQYKVHPAADVFPMMSDEELDALGADIAAHGQTIPALLWRNADNPDPVLIDGRNRLEAIERHCKGVEPLVEVFTCKDPVTHIITLNIRRRHLTKQQQADLIVAAIKAGEKPRQDGEVSAKVWIKSPCGTPLWETPFDTGEEFEAAARAGGRGKKNKLKEKAVAVANEYVIGKRTIERSIARAEGKTPKPATKEPGIAAARKQYLAFFAELEDCVAMMRETWNITRALDKMTRTKQEGE